MENLINKNTKIKFGVKPNETIEIDKKKENKIATFLNNWFVLTQKENVFNNNIHNDHNTNNN